MLRMLGLGEGAATNSMGERTIGWGTLAIEGETGTADVSIASALRWCDIPLTYTISDDSGKRF